LGGGPENYKKHNRSQRKHANQWVYRGEKKDSLNLQHFWGSRGGEPGEKRNKTGGSGKDGWVGVSKRLLKKKGSTLFTPRREGGGEKFPQKQNNSSAEHVGVCNRGSLKWGRGGGTVRNSRLRGQEEQGDCKSVVKKNQPKRWGVGCTGRNGPEKVGILITEEIGEIGGGGCIKRVTDLFRKMGR